MIVHSSTPCIHDLEFFSLMYHYFVCFLDYMNGDTFQSMVAVELSWQKSVSPSSITHTTTQRLKAEKLQLLASITEKDTHSYTYLDMFFNTATSGTETGERQYTASLCLFHNIIPCLHSDDIQELFVSWYNRAPEIFRRPMRVLVNL